MSNNTPDQPSRDPIRLGSAIDSFLKRVEGPDRVAAGSIFSEWRSIVGDSIADHVTPIRLKGSTLLVEAADQAWLTQMKFLYDDLLNTLRQHTGNAIEVIEMRVKRVR
jgi:predicted nucleic acid-binding Zn ribbon protein